MRDRWVVWLGLALLLAVTLACNAFAGQVEPSLPSPPQPTVPLAPGVATPLPGTAPAGIAPTATLPGEETPAAGGGTLRMLSDLNVRAGPGVGYERVGFLLRDETAVILGRDEASGWWKIVCPPQAEGSECWVSGSAQYTRAENGDAAPTAAVPATPTPAPPDPPPNTGLLFFVDSGRLYATTLDLSRDPPAAAPPRQLVEAASVQRVAAAPDGRSVAFTALDPTTGHNELRLVNADGGNERTLVRAAGLPRVPEAAELPAAANDDARVQVLDFQWQADGATLLFNTALINPIGYSAGSQSDLWTVGIDGQLTERLAAGRGLPRFAVSSGDRVMLVGRREIVRVASDGRDLESVLTFEPSQLRDGFYYPTVQWRDDGAAAFVAVAEPFDALSGDAAGAPAATLWRIPATGAVEGLGRLRADVFAWPPLWSDDGDRLAFRRANGSALILAQGDGRRPEVIAQGEALRALDWWAAPPRLLFIGPEYVAVADAGQLPVAIPLTGEQPGRGRWLSETAFLLEIVTADGTAGLFALRRDGSRELLAPLSATGAAFDVWLP
jgi:hypothetical protein